MWLYGVRKKYENFYNVWNLKTGIFDIQLLNIFYKICIAYKSAHIFSVTLYSEFQWKADRLNGLVVLFNVL